MKISGSHTHIHPSATGPVPSQVRKASVYPRPGLSVVRMIDRAASGGLGFYPPFPKPGHTLCPPVRLGRTVRGAGV